MLRDTEVVVRAYRESAAIVATPVAQRCEEQAVPCATPIRRQPPDFDAAADTGRQQSHVGEEHGTPMPLIGLVQDPCLKLHVGSEQIGDAALASNDPPAPLKDRAEDVSIGESSLPAAVSTADPMAFRVTQPLLPRSLRLPWATFGTVSGDVQRGHDQCIVDIIPPLGTPSTISEISTGCSMMTDILPGNLGWSPIPSPVSSMRSTPPIKARKPRQSLGCPTSDALSKVLFPSVVPLIARSPKSSIPLRISGQQPQVCGHLPLRTLTRTNSEPILSRAAAKPANNDKRTSGVRSLRRHSCTHIDNVSRSSSPLQIPTFACAPPRATSPMKTPPAKAFVIQSNNLQAPFRVREVSPDEPEREPRAAEDRTPPREDSRSRRRSASPREAKEHVAKSACLFPPNPIELPGNHVPGAAAEKAAGARDTMNSRRAECGLALLRGMCSALNVALPAPYTAERDLACTADAVVEELFFDSMPRDEIVICDIEEVADAQLVQRFLRRLVADSADKVNVEATFHGTSSSNISGILRHGLLTETCRTAAYGEGAYVGTHAGVANQYADADEEGCRYMCVVLAAVGGQARKGSSGRRHSVTTLDRLSNPTQYCFVDEDRLLPSHLITYRVHQSSPRKRIGGGFEDAFERQLYSAVSRAGRQVKLSGLR